jgi:hypothetical protein
VWALPLAAVGAVFLIGAAAFQWCGVWGCYQGRHGSAAAVVLLSLAAGGVVGVTVGLVLWSRRRGVRAAVGTCVGAVIAACSAVYVLGL